MTSTRPSLWKQLLGAAIGGGLALALYAGYEVTQPRLTALLSLPPIKSDEAVGVADKNMDKEEYERIAARTREIASKFYRRTGKSAVQDTELRALSRKNQRTATPSLKATVVEPESEPPPAPPEPLPPPSLPAQEPEPAEEVVQSEAPALPSSGFAFWLSACLALLAAGVMHHRKIYTLLCGR